MLHSPLTVPHSTVYSSVSPLGSQNMNNSETLRLPTALPTFLPSGLPLSTLQPQFKSPMSSVPNSLTVSLNPYSTPHSSLTFGTDGTNSLSGSSSLSSSLVSLHSTPPTGTPLTHKSSQLNSLTSTPRCSLWLKLQVCPSWHPQSTGGLTPASINTTDVTASSTTVAVQNKESKTSSDDSLGECPLPPNTCPYAHPTPNILVENGFVTVCYDFIKRKNCKHSCCKYYHPPAHQIEAILKRGDEQKKLLEGQQKLLESKTAALLNMHPAQPPAPNGLSGVCTAGLTWPPASLIQHNGTPVYGAYLTPVSQPLSMGLTQLGGATLQLPFTATASDPSALNTSALLAAAAALQQQQQQQTIPGSGLLVATSSSKASASSESVSIGQHLNDTSRTATLLSTSASNGLYTGTGTYASNGVAVGSESWYPAKRANHTGGFSGEVTSKASDTADNGVTGIMCNGATSQPSQDRPNSESSVSTSVTGEFTSDPSGPLSQMFSCSTTTTANGLSFSPAFYGSVAPHPANSSNAVTSLLNPMNVNLYGLSLPSVQAASPYVSPQLAPFPSTLYSNPTDNPSPMATAAATLALNSWLQQQQQQQTQTYSQQTQSQATPVAAAHPLLPTQVSGAHPIPTNTAALAAALAAVQQQQQQQQQQQAHSSADLHSVAQQPQQHSPAFQHQSQQQALLLSTLLRAQQSQLAAAQMAAAVQAAGYLQNSSSPRPMGMLDSAYQLPGALAGLQATPYGATFPCIQNPITNVAYINDKGHLLETLPICRDFKAGKCHRNGDCRYVHLVDENVEVSQGRVIVCRDAAKGRCTRVPCKYYHVPLHAISANRSLALNSVLANATAVPNNNAVTSGGVTGQGL